MKDFFQSRIVRTIETVKCGSKYPRKSWLEIDIYNEVPEFTRPKIIGNTKKAESN